MASTLEAAQTKTETPAALLELTWTDPVSGKRGYLVIERLVRGVSSGGLRMREGCTLDEVRGLAKGMGRKEAVHYRPGARYVPLGGAKGGIDCSHDDPDARGILRRFLSGVRPLLEQYWVTGEDLGVRQDMIDDAIGELGLESSSQAVFRLLPDRDQAIARFDAAFEIKVEGIELGLLVGGLGVAEAALTALERLGTSVANLRAVVQGFGSMGGATARYLQRAGVCIVGIADAEGVVTNPDGLNVEELLATRDESGRIDRSRLQPEDQQLPSSEWLNIDCEILVPAAVSYSIDEHNQADVRASLIVEAANMPVLPDAEKQLAERGVTVIPDFVANSATNAWWYWTLFGDVEADAEAAFSMVRSQMRRIVDATFDRCARDGVTPREAALSIVTENINEIDARFGDV